MPRFKIYAALLVLGVFCISHLPANANKPGNLENYAYRYITELYKRGESESLVNEINAFLARYPQSYYQNHLRALRADLAQEEGLHEEALKAYDDLLPEDLELPLRHRIYLHRAVSLLALERNSEALQQIQILESETKDTFLLSRANLYRARLYKSFKQYYSAMISYQNSLKEQPDPEVEYEYMEVLIQLGKEDEAKAFLLQINDQSHIFIKSHVMWLKHLLDSNRLDEFDQHLESIPQIHGVSSVELLRLRKAFTVQDYAKAEEILQQSNNSGEYYSFYRALLQERKGNYSSADKSFAELVSSAGTEIKVLSYLERLKIIYKKEPVSAMLQLAQFMQSPASNILKAEQLYTMGYFSYSKQDYREALAYLAQARGESKNRLLLADIDLLIAQSWLKQKDSSASLNSFNRYLNLYPAGKNRDTALYYLGYLYHEAKDYTLASTAFKSVVSEYPSSIHIPSAKFYLAEIDFYMANYNLALSAFLEIISEEPHNSDAILRVAQIYYYLGRHDEALPYLSKLSPSYDSLILEGHINFVKKDYEKALSAFQRAENISKDALKVSEAKSYRALCLYQMKRFTEASRLYMELFQGKESPDTYLYLGAKSAYSAGDFHLALDLFDQFLTTYPESQYFLPVLADVANSYFNMGNYDQATQDYMNILRRFRNTAEFNSRDQALLREVFTGLELSLSRITDPLPANELADMTDSFNSQYVRFELTFLLTKLYAGKQRWADVLAEAEALRQNFPDHKRTEIELLMAESLINLNEYHRADSLLSTLYSDTLDLQALVSWAEVDVLTNNYQDALQKFVDALDLQPEAELWYKALKASVAAGYQDFEVIWEKGMHYIPEVPEAQILRLEYLMSNSYFQEAEALADIVINESLNTHDHALAFFYKAQILYEQSDYSIAIQELRKISMLFPDYPDIQEYVAYYTILSYWEMGAHNEAKMQLWDNAKLLSEEHLNSLNELLEEVPE